MQFKANAFPCLGPTSAMKHSLRIVNKGVTGKLPLVRDMRVLGHEHNEPIFGAYHLVASRCGSTRGLSAVATRPEGCRPHI